MSTPEDSNSKLTRLAGVSNLRAPGADSNYLDWEFKMELALENLEISHVLEVTSPASRTDSWMRANTKACTLISWAVDDINIQYIKPYKRDAAGMWASLKRAHKDSSCGGRLHLIQQLITMRMEGEDIDAHIQAMHKIFDRLDSLVDTDNPLTPDDIFTLALINSLPADWVHVVTPLMQRPTVDSATVLRAIQTESTRRKSSTLTSNLDATAARAGPPRTSDKGKSKPKSSTNSSSTRPKNTKLCVFCKRLNHTVENCWELEELVKEREGRDQIPTTKTTSDSKSKASTKAGMTSVVSLDFSDSDESEDNNNTVPARAKSAKVLCSSTNLSSAWTVDSGCSVIMTPDSDMVKDQRPSKKSIGLADSSSIRATHSGTTTLPIAGITSVPSLLVPDLQDPLLSVAAVCDQDITVVFTARDCLFYRSSDVNIEQSPVGRGIRSGNLYYLSKEVRFPSSDLACTTVMTDSSSLLAWHQRLGHIGLKPLKSLLKTSNISPSSYNEIEVQQCPVCVSSKMSRHSFKTRDAYRSDSAGQLIHTDVGSFEVSSREGFKYFITFIDDYSKYTAIYPMKLKSDSLNCFKTFRASFELLLSTKIKAIRSDNGGEFMSQAFSSLLRELGISHNDGPPHSPQLYGLAERTNRTVGNQVRCALSSASLPKPFWVDALRYYCHTLNSVPCYTQAGFKSPNAVLNLPTVDLARTHPFGCLAWYKVPEADRRKLDPKARQGILLSYLADGNGYRLWDKTNRKVIKSRDVLFRHDQFPYVSTPDRSCEPEVNEEISWPHMPSNPTPQRVGTQRHLSASIHNPRRRALSPSMFEDVPSPPLHQSPAPSTTPSPSTPSPSPPPAQPPPSPPLPSRHLRARPPPPPPEPQAAVRRSSRRRAEPDRLGHWSKSASTDSADVQDTPKTWKQLLRSPSKEKWLKAADSEFSSLVGMNTWKLVPRPLRRKIIKSKWIFKIKRRVDNSIIKLKARLVAMGYSQIQGVDYTDVFAPTTRLETLRLVLSLLASRRWSGRQIDIKTAFLNGHLESPVYMSQPEGYEDPEHPDWVCEVQRSIYGLKQSPRQWNSELHEALVGFGFVQSSYDPTLYFSLRQDKLVGLLTVHVDDIAIVGTDDFVKSAIDSISGRFEVSSNEELHHFLSLDIKRDIPARRVYLSQEHYIRDVASRFLPSGHTPTRTPTSSTFKDLSPREPSDQGSSGNYSSLIGALLWVAQCTRPDVSFAVNRLSQYLRDPSDDHWQAGIRVLNYLVSTSHLPLSLGGDAVVSGYSDADWAEDRHDRRSTTGYTYRFGCGPISWRSRKQTTVSLSSTESEYKALSDSCREGLWIRNLLHELKIRPLDAIPLHVDNEGAEALAKNPQHHSRTKHIHTRFHFVRECVKAKHMSLCHVSSADMLADMLTKPLNRVLLESHRRKFGIGEFL